MSQITVLAEWQLTGSDGISIELVEANETPAVVIIRWPHAATVIQPRRFAEVARTVVQMFAEAHTALQRSDRSASYERRARSPRCPLAGAVEPAELAARGRARYVPVRMREESMMRTDRRSEAFKHGRIDGYLDGLDGIYEPASGIPVSAARSITTSRRRTQMGTSSAMMPG